MKFITRSDIDNIRIAKRANSTIIFLSGPTSLKTPIDTLRNHDVITVNGAARYLIDKDIKPFIYILTDSRFIRERREDFYHFTSNSQFTIVNSDVYEKSSEEDKKYLDEHAYVIRSLYQREKGGPIKKLSLEWMARRNENIYIRVPISRKKRLVGFSKHIADGYCSCHTVAFAAIQLAYTLQFGKIIMSGLDMKDSCTRFYDEQGNPMPSELSRDLQKILPFFSFMKTVVPDIEIYNLSDNTSVDYNIIPFISPDEL